jgi:hypothetical protein
MDKFEYKIINVSKVHLAKENFQSELISTLNDLGSEGWEIISVEGINEGSIFWRVSETVDLLLFLKRKLS